MGKGKHIATCQRCGIGFIVTDNYRQFLERRGSPVTVPVQCTSCFWRTGPLPKQRGRIKWFNPRKGYGFIVTEREREVFFHQDQLLADNGNKPQEGQTAHFHVRYASKGPQALNVELTGAE